MLLITVGEAVMTLSPSFSDSPSLEMILKTSLFFSSKVTSSPAFASMVAMLPPIAPAPIISIFMIKRRVRDNFWVKPTETAHTTYIF